MEGSTTGFGTVSYKVGEDTDDQEGGKGDSGIRKLERGAREEEEAREGSEVDGRDNIALDSGGEDESQHNQHPQTLMLDDKREMEGNRSVVPREKGERGEDEGNNGGKGKGSPNKRRKKRD